MNRQLYESAKTIGLASSGPRWCWQSFAFLGYTGRNRRLERLHAGHVRGLVIG